MQPSNNRPLISILVPVFNVGQYLDECIDSIVRQDYRPIQVVLHNDGSTDNSLEICKKYAQKYPFIDVYSDINRGVASARNSLLEKIKGDYFIFVDADDWIKPEMISYLYQILSEHNSDIAICGKVSSDKNDSVCVIDWNRDAIIKEFLKHKKISGSLWNKLTKVSLLHNERFRCGIFYGEDALFTWKLIQRVDKVTITDKPLYNYRPNPGSLSRSKWTPEKKGTGFQVWREICEDVERLYPEYLDIAYSRSGYEVMWALYFASTSDYKKDEHIRMRQKYIKEHIRYMKKYQLDGHDKYLTACIICRWYGFGKVLNVINNIKNV